MINLLYIYFGLIIIYYTKYSKDFVIAVLRVILKRIKCHVLVNLLTKDNCSWYSIFSNHEDEAADFS